MGNRLPSTTPSIVRRLFGQREVGPSAVFDQSVERISEPMSPPPASQSPPAEVAPDFDVLRTNPHEITETVTGAQGPGGVSIDLRLVRTSNEARFPQDARAEVADQTSEKYRRMSGAQNCSAVSRT
jgi:hypothetical protein